MRTQKGIIFKYDLLWGAVRDWVATQSARGATLPELLHGAFLMTNGITPGDACVPALPEVGQVIVRGQRIPLSLISQEYTLRALVSETIMRAVRHDADVIAELGAGWSANLFNLWLRGAPSKALYLGCELTKAGRDAALALATSEPRLRFGAPPFDWLAPDYAFMPRDARHITVFSNYSIEQVPELATVVFERLFAATQQAQTLQGVHLEPLSWQYPERTTPALVEHGRQYAIERSYNLNGRAIFEELERAGRIRISRTEVDVFGWSEMNLATIIQWERV